MLLLFRPFFFCSKSSQRSHSPLFSQSPSNLPGIPRHFLAALQATPFPRGIPPGIPGETGRHPFRNFRRRSPVLPFFFFFLSHCILSWRSTPPQSLNTVFLPSPPTNIFGPMGTNRPFFFVDYPGPLSFFFFRTLFYFSGVWAPL